MAGTFPILSSGQVAKYPVQRSRTYLTEVVKFINDKEQRWVKRAPLEAFALQFTSLNADDVETLREFFNSQLGMFDKTWTLEFDGVTYEHMVFAHDEFREEESDKMELFNVTLQCRQVRKT